MKFFLLASALAAAGATEADTLRTSPVMTHPSQGEKAAVAGATSRLAVHSGGVFVNFETSGLTPGNVHTLWFVAINDPAQCETENCTSKDVLKRSDIVQSDVGYAGGVIVGDDGSASFNWFQAEGALDGGWFGNGLKNGDAAEIHLVVNDHGPVIDGRVDEMLSTYRDGCTDASIPAPMPDTARVQGEAGPNQCRLVQFTVFKAAQPQS